MQPLSIAIQNFNNKVKQMNQTNSKQMILSNDEARNLHSDIFNLLTNLAESSAKPQEIRVESSSINMDGGGFK